jgi:undecaprenyl diphosphate synthase
MAPPPGREARITATQEREQMSEQELLASLDLRRLPRHVAVIMDGNGRWAEQRGLPRVEGHRASMQSIRDTVSGCSQIGVGFLTLYAFSTENWSRPKDEVAALMFLIEQTLHSQVPELHENQVVIRHLGRRDGLPQSLLDTIDASVQKTAGNTGLTLQLAVNYGGRQEIVTATMAAGDRPEAGRGERGGLRRSSLPARGARPGPAGPHRRRHAHLQLPAVGGCVRRDLGNANAVARLPKGGAVSRHCRLPGPPAEVREGGRRGVSRLGIGVKNDP